MQKSNNQVLLTKNRFLLALKVLLFTTASVFVRANTDDRPNIVLILADDMGYSDLGVMGSEIPTPSLDALAQEGTLFTNFYTTARCSSTRASLLTGLYSHSAGVGHLDQDRSLPGYRGFMNDASVTIADLLAQSNYRTIISGKWHLGKKREYWPDRYGFERQYTIPAGGGFYYYPSVRSVRNIYRNDERVIPDSSDYYVTEALTDEAINFIDEAQKEEKPFFLYLAHIAPHFPLQAPEEETNKYLGQYLVGYETIRNARFEKQRSLGLLPDEALLSPITKQVKVSLERSDRKMAVYAAQVNIMDREIGRLINFLKSSDLYENTVIFFLSDNGAASKGHNSGDGEIGSPTSFYSYGKRWANVSNTPYREYKRLVHEGGIITPMIMHWPNQLKGDQKVIREPLHVIDIMPTILDIADVEYPNSFDGQTIKSVQGETFLPLAREGTQLDKRSLFWEHEGNKAVRKGKYKAVMRRSREWELYNIESDPTELVNLADENALLLNFLISRHEKWASENFVEEWPLNR